jgi:hypothetical protein
MYKKLLVMIPILMLGFIPFSYIYVQGQSYQTIQIFNGNLGLKPGQGVLYHFSVPDDAKNIYLRGSVSVSGGALDTITISLYDESLCPPPDSEGIRDWSSCTGVVSHDYSSDIAQYIPHGGSFYLNIVDGSSFFNKVVNGDIYVEYLPGG